MHQIINFNSITFHFVVDFDLCVSLNLNRASPKVESAFNPSIVSTYSNSHY